MDHRPNLFELAPSELSQDAFIGWFLLWARQENTTDDPGLNAGGRDLLGLIYRLHGKVLPEIETLALNRQYKHVDLLLVVNNLDHVLVEDKVYSQEHSGQLERYIDSMKEVGVSQDVTLPVYLQTGDQADYSAVESAGYCVVSREDLLRARDEITIAT